MGSPKDTVVIGLLGTKLDGGTELNRWERWRPTLSVHQQDDLLVARTELLFHPRYRKLADVLTADIAAVSPTTEVRHHAFETGDPWNLETNFEALHAFARAYDFDTEREDYLLHITTGTHVAQICLFLLTESRHFPARLLQTQPSRDTGPGAYSVIDLDLSRYDAIARRFDEEQREALDFLKSGIQTLSATFNAQIARIEKVAIRSRAPLLLMGPTGAGKSHLASRIFALKEARHQVDGPFVEVNCATLRGDMAMSTLFGHRRGAFTGATSDRPGLLKSASGGVLFLDEVGELGADEQAMLLRAIEEKRWMPVGSDREVSGDFQLICGTNRDLAADVAEGRFREDLLARINLWTFELPGLRERPEDIAPNLDFELERYAQTHGSRVTMAKDARERFLAFATSGAAVWRANFRDLNAAVTRMATLAPGGRIGVDEVREEIARLERAWRPAGTEDGGGGDLLERLLGPEGLADLDRFDRVQLADVVEVVARARTLSDAGRTLFAVSRTKKKSSNDADRLRKYLARYGLDFQQIVDASRA